MSSLRVDGDGLELGWGGPDQLGCEPLREGRSATVAKRSFISPITESKTGCEKKNNELCFGLPIAWKEEAQCGPQTNGVCSSAEHGFVLSVDCGQRFHS